MWPNPQFPPYLVAFAEQTMENVTFCAVIVNV